MNDAIENVKALLEKFQFLEVVLGTDPFWPWDVEPTNWNVVTMAQITHN